MISKVQSLATVGSSSIVIEIECHISNNLPSIVIVGFASKATDEAKERLRGAFTSSGIHLPKKKLTLNLAPADIPKDGSGFDLAMAAAVLETSSQTKHGFTQSEAIMGELGLDGKIRPLRGVIGKLLAGRKCGIDTFYIPLSNLAQAKLVPNIKLIPVKNLHEFYTHLSGTHIIPAIDTKGGDYESIKSNPGLNNLLLTEIAGQQQAKRALAIAAAGGHNVLLTGPPGTGKSMLAKSLATILPPLSLEETLEVTHIHSLASGNFDDIIGVRPFRSPHHSASNVSITGGGYNLRPGEISLSHRGVLFLDEFPEFNRVTLEALRQPLEDKVVRIVRAKDTAEYPSNFILVATANPCPCGYYGTSKECICQPYQVLRYQQKISGPILDRIDIHTQVNEVKHEKLLRSAETVEDATTIIKLVSDARAIQSKRFGLNNKLNSDMSNSEIKSFAALSSETETILNSAASKLKLSPRSYMRVIKVARTVADLEGSEPISPKHLTEALQYRSKNRLS